VGRGPGDRHIIIILYFGETGEDVGNNPFVGLRCDGPGRKHSYRVKAKSVWFWSSRGRLQGAQFSRIAGCGKGARPVGASRDCHYRSPERWWCALPSQRCHLGRQSRPWRSAQLGFEEESARPLCHLSLPSTSPQHSYGRWIAWRPCACQQFGLRQGHDRAPDGIEDRGGDEASLKSPEGGGVTSYSGGGEGTEVERLLSGGPDGIDPVDKIHALVGSIAFMWFSAGTVSVVGFSAA